MPSLLKLTPEIHVNSTLAFDQLDPDVAVLTDGSYVVVWRGNGPGDSSGIFLQRYDSSGVPDGVEMRVNTTTTNAQDFPKVAALADGGFVVAWTSHQVAVSEVYSQRYTAGGGVAGTETLVSVVTGVGHTSSDIVGLSDGKYVIAFQEATLNDSYVRMFNADGTPFGVVARVNTFTTGLQALPTLAATQDGGFVVTWSSIGQEDGNDPINSGVYFQRYQFDGLPLGTETHVNQTLAGFQTGSVAAVLADGSFVVAWQSSDQDEFDASDEYGIYLRHFDSSGVPLSSEIQVNSIALGSQYAPRITALDDGGYVVTWTGYTTDEFDTEVYAQRFDSADHAIGPESVVNSYTTDAQTSSAVSALPGGGFIVAWNSRYQDGSEYGVYSRAWFPTSNSNGTQHVYGTADGDVLDGGAGADRMYGGFGDDTYIVNNADDFVGETQGSWTDGGYDTVIASVGFTLVSRPDVENLILTGYGAINGFGNESANIMIGNDAANALHGNGGEDAITGNGGNDYIDAWTGEDTVDGGAGNDTIYGYFGNDVLIGGLGNDTISGEYDNDYVDGGAGADIITGGDGDDDLHGGDGADTVSGGTGSDYIDGGSGNDNVNANEGVDTVYGGDGNDTLHGGDETDFINGGAGYDALYGDGGDDIIDGGDGNDLIDDSGGNDLLNGGAGDDYVIGGGGNNRISGGADIDTYDARHLSGAAIISLASGQARQGGYLSLLNGIENLIGTNLADALVGDAGNNDLDGLGGIDKMYGGGGSDTYHVDDAGDIVSELLGGADAGGEDTVFSTVSYALGGYLESLVLQGSAINGTGNGLDNYLTGNDVGNLLNGGAGADVMRGGAGNDTFVVDNLSDEVSETGNGFTDDSGVDLVQSSVNFALGVFVENLTLTGTTAILATGNELDNLLNGNAINNTLYGYGGADSLNGGTGNDSMFGGAGNDTYTVDSLLDTVSEQMTPGSDDGGADRVNSSVNFTLGTFLETLALTGTNNVFATGNGMANSLIGNSGNNYLTGLAGADALTGNGGVDTFAFSAAAINGNDRINDFVSGTDKLQFDDADYAGLATSGLLASQYTIGAAAVGAGAQFVYNPANRVLYWDSNGSTAGGLTAIATFANNAQPVLGDFLII